MKMKLPRRTPLRSYESAQGQPALPTRLTDAFVAQTQASHLDAERKSTHVEMANVVSPNSTIVTYESRGFLRRGNQ